MLFRIPDAHRTNTNAGFQIVEDFQCLHYDEMPILYCGRNAAGEYVIGSVCCENDDAPDDAPTITRCLHTVVGLVEYLGFTVGDLTYRALLLSAKEMFAVDFNEDDTIEAVYKIPPALIPENYLPKKEVRCPRTREAG